MSKPATTYHEQLALLKSRGLSVPDEPFALHVLEHHNYYRLSAYRFSFTVSGNPDMFLPGTTFSQIWELYNFDRGLSQLVLEAYKLIEISARSHWAYELAHRHGPLAYLDAAHFRNPQLHGQTILKLQDEMDRSKEAFIRHHQATLGMPWPPSWVIAEVAPFGMTSNLIGQLKDPALRQIIADAYRLDEKTLCSLLHHLSVVRNIAAHHSRLWNRSFTFTMQVPRKKPAYLFPNFNVTRSSFGNLRERRIYNSLVLLVHLVEVIEPQSSWPLRLINLLKQLDPALLCEMEVPGDWQSRPLWKALLP
jgi:abortive infection bacteriophage resistance protein